MLLLFLDFVNAPQRLFDRRCVFEESPMSATIYVFSPACLSVLLLKLRQDVLSFGTIFLYLCCVALPSMALVNLKKHL